MSKPSITAIATVIAAFVGAFGLYIAVDQHRREGVDYMPTLIVCIVNAVALTVLVFAIGLNCRDAIREKRVRALMANLKYEYETQTNSTAATHRKAIAELTAAHELAMRRECDERQEASQHERSRLYRYFAEEVRRAERIAYLSADIDALWRCLEHQISAATTNGSVPEMLQYPLSDRVKKQEFGWVGVPIEVWKFQRDFTLQQSKLRAQITLVPNLKAVFAKPTTTLPSEHTAEHVIELLKDCAQELREESNRIWREMESA